ncbi:tRNA (adenosine(37)-N6)-dimethylallyltransferase MiaA [Candidatus Nomurabacteria bacterium RIFCSPHIGHO2_02_FULL_33_12]|uniref:tRNA dimethylallyltransferase n=1 Tax=Candidatus Nomurabacteria bacterium RIFCSPLOWO2_01_FULL_33_17 TaxID=1801764 RepID=A0A1F6WMP4_9BACT|nr:MAG: tRNA (adenosine(37)-N6)-dimethylallyltransferase MiaA [Candidatus Nomurabacteria bacterium RIFCSPHIGHO2_02_FULL_33_12]OGI83149.1 MAG: tRNA (adenosine(37)-N6)-dimethylallyltransferase MiaA [Candidatus Nomurabacteria bacterium RIFCSPLOWO2_01_FULL_33_17]
MNKVIVICGQTSTGKSDFAVSLAKWFSTPSVLKDISPLAGGEIVSADSRQVYIGLDIGSGKITEKEMKGIPHHMLSIVNPNKVFNVNDYKKLANKKIKEIIKRGNLPIICGGTGFYIDAIINDSVFPKVPPNLKLRLELENKTTTELFKILKKLDKTRAENIDKNNPVRLIRAIEIATALGSVPPTTHKSDLWPKYKVLKIGLMLPDEVLKERIYKRIIKRIKMGMIDEVKTLNNKGLSWARMEDLGLEYRYISQYLQGLMTKSEMLEKLNTESWHYAKRQKTWFKRDKSTIWLNPLDKKETSEVYKKIKEFLES